MLYPHPQGYYCVQLSSTEQASHNTKHHLYVVLTQAMQWSSFTYSICFLSSSTSSSAPQGLGLQPVLVSDCLSNFNFVSLVVLLYQYTMQWMVPTSVGTYEVYCLITGRKLTMWHPFYRLNIDHYFWTHCSLSFESHDLCLFFQIFVRYEQRNADFGSPQRLVHPSVLLVRFGCCPERVSPLKSLLLGGVADL